MTKPKKKPDTRRAPTRKEVAAIAAAKSVSSARPARATMDVSMKDQGVVSAQSQHTDDDGAAILVNEAFGTVSVDFAMNSLAHLINATMPAITGKAHVGIADRTAGATAGVARTAAAHLVLGALAAVVILFVVLMARQHVWATLLAAAHGVPFDPRLITLIVAVRTPVRVSTCHVQQRDQHFDSIADTLGVEPAQQSRDLHHAEICHRKPAERVGGKLGVQGA